jgi:hypothetical protein
MRDNGDDQQLVGKWRSDPDDASINEYGDVSLDFSPNGGLAYTVHTEGKRQVMLLTYRVEGEILITDQPSDPKEERTRFKIRPDGRLVLMYEHRSSAYVRADDSSSPFPAISLN